jgi:predicted alpha/beta-fold hydrolase
VSEGQYRPPRGFTNAHVQTIWPARTRKVDGVAYRRERIDTPDGDFLDLDWSEVGAERVAVLSHGLEGSTGRSYMRGMARALNRRGWDVLAWNYRGCSGEPNRLLHAYHSGATDDLDVVVRHALEGGRYRRLALLGFSLGGNLTLKYLGERGRAADDRIRGAATFSVPCDLADSSAALARPTNRLYMAYFLASLRRKIKDKMALFPGQLDETGLGQIRDFQGFDDRYTAPLHGFRDAADYWARCSARPFIPDIRVPTLIVNAADDPFLGPSCYPIGEARANPYVRLEVPDHGGHVGFILFNREGDYWSELRAADFLEKVDDFAG